FMIAANSTFAQTRIAPTYFRSDSGLANTDAGSLPDRFDAPTKLVWRTRVDSGQSSPVLSNGRIFLTTYRAEDHELATVAVDQKSGRVLWKQAISAELIEQFHPSMGSPAAATPACDGERVFVFFGSYGLICYNLEGRKLWDHPLGSFRDEYGASSSPMIVDDKVILCEDHDIDSFLIALDTRTGKVLWKTPRPDAVKSYATPVLWSHGGRRELLVAGALELAGYDPSNGEKIWWVNGLARIVIPVPVPVGDTIFMASWAPGGDSGAKLTLDPWKSALEKWDKNSDGKLSKDEVADRTVLERYFRMDLNQDGSLDQREWERHASVFSRAENAALAIKPSGRGALTDKAVVWKYRRGVPYVPTPVVHNGVLWMVKDGGIVTRLDAPSGKLLSEERLPGPGGYYASPVGGDGKIYFASEGGVVSVVADEPNWRVISSQKLGGKIFATPILSGNCIFIRTEDSLYCYEHPLAEK
ncbi:MAG: PQQ-binding-like beta-propeller repeat protein, partial [Verrucomicrobiota bacterium]